MELHWLINSSGGNQLLLECFISVIFLNLIQTVKWVFITAAFWFMFVVPNKVMADAITQDAASSSACPVHTGRLYSLAILTFALENISSDQS